MITLYTAPSLWELLSISPSCMELETWLRMAKRPYKPVFVTLQEFAAAPKGKIPFIDYNGKLIGDATLIIEMLKQKEGIDIDANLTPSERAISLAFRRMLKENTYWGGVHVRYKIEENWKHYREILGEILFTDTSSEQREPVLKELQEGFLSQMYNHGIGRHNYEEIVQIICSDFQALSDFLADKLFFIGDEPTYLDATAYAYIGNLIKPPYGSPIVDYVLKLENLCQHYERMNERYPVRNGG